MKTTTAGCRTTLGRVTACLKGGSKKSSRAPCDADSAQAPKSGLDRSRYLRQRVTAPHAPFESPARDASTVETLTVTVGGPCNEDWLPFRIKRRNPLSKLMDAYCARRELDKDNVEFWFDCSKLLETDTPERLAMKDNDRVACLFAVCPVRAD